MLIFDASEGLIGYQYNLRRSTIWFITREIKVSSLETVTCNSSSISSVSVHNISDIIVNKKRRSNLVAMFKYTQKCFRFCKQKMNVFSYSRINNVFPTISIVVTQHVCHIIFIAFMISTTLLVFTHV